MKRVALLLVVLAAAAAAVPALASTRTVRLDDNRFEPTSLTVRRGDTVRFRWAGDRPHNVTVQSGPQRFASRTQTEGTYSRRVTRAGRYEIVCTIHAGMSMRLRVRAP